MAYLLFLLWKFCCGSEEREPKLIIRVINFELVQPTRPRYINVTDRQTDGRTVGRLTIANTALCNIQMVINMENLVMVSDVRILFCPKADSKISQR